MILYKLIGFNNYIIKNKILYRKSYTVRDKRCKYKSISERKINKTFKNNIEGYFLVRNNKRKFYSLKGLKHRLQKITEYSYNIQ